MPEALTHEETCELRDLLDVAIRAIHDGAPVTKAMLEPARDLAQQQLDVHGRSTHRGIPERASGERWYVVPVLYAAADSTPEHAAQRVSETCGPAAVYVGAAHGVTDAQITAADFATTVLHADAPLDAAARTAPPSRFAERRASAEYAHDLIGTARLFAEEDWDRDAGVVNLRLPADLAEHVLLARGWRNSEWTGNVWCPPLDSVTHAMTREADMDIMFAELADALQVAIGVEGAAAARRLYAAAADLGTEPAQYLSLNDVYERLAFGPCDGSGDIPDGAAVLTCLGCSGCANPTAADA